MRKVFLFFVLALILAPLAGCMGIKLASPEELANADYGPPPKTKDVEGILRAGLFGVLFDPASAIFKFHEEPMKGYKRKGSETTYGWGGRVQVNAKNRMGAYVGANWCRYLIRNGEVVGFEQGLNVDEGRSSSWANIIIPGILTR